MFWDGYSIQLKSKILRLWKESLGVWGTFGVLIATISIFNLLVRSLDLGLSVVVADIVNTYNWLFHDVIFGVLWQFFSFKIDARTIDLIILWSALSGTCIRTMVTIRSHYHDGVIHTGVIEHYLFTLHFLKFVAIIIILSITLWPILLIRFIYSREMKIFLPSIGRRRLVGYSILVRPVKPYILNFDSELDPGGFVTYRNIWVTQLLVMALLIFLLVLTNAGLPGTIS